jgi:hypothetical protein
MRLYAMELLELRPHVNASTHYLSQFKILKKMYNLIISVPADAYSNQPIIKVLLYLCFKYTTTNLSTFISFPLLRFLAEAHN